MTLLANILAKLNGEISLDPAEVILSDTDLLMTGLVDSLGVLKLVSWLEDTLQVVIDPGDIVLEHFESPQLIVDFVSTLTAQPAS